MQPLPNLTIQQLQYLVAVADSPTWATAASELGVTPSALSQGLAELERRLDFPLFQRDGRRRVLAPLGSEVLTYARGVLTQTNDLDRWLHDARSGRVSPLRVGMIDAAATTRMAMAWQRPYWSTTAAGSSDGPILAVPTG